MTGRADTEGVETFSIPEDWSIYGDPCPCCGAEGEYEEGWDGETGDEWGFWAHAQNPDVCLWQAGHEKPCLRWPHPALTDGPEVDDGQS